MVHRSPFRCGACKHETKRHTGYCTKKSCRCGLSEAECFNPSLVEREIVLIAQKKKQARMNKIRYKKNLKKSSKRGQPLGGSAWVNFSKATAT